MAHSQNAAGGGRTHANVNNVTAPSQPQSHRPAPPGFELFFRTERANIKDTFEAMVLPLHWSITRGGLRIRSSDSNPVSSSIPLSELSESLPGDWTSKIMRKQEEGSQEQMRYLVLKYWDSSNSSIHFEAKIIEVVANSTVVMILFRADNSSGVDGNVKVANAIDMNSSSTGRNAAATNFMFHDFLVTSNNENGTGRPFQGRSWFEVYKNLQMLESQVWEQLMDPLGLCVSGKVREPGPYESKLANQNQGQGQSQSQQNQQQQQPQQPIYGMTPTPYPSGGIGGPLFVPPAVPPGGGGLGRSDLDPLGGFGAGNVADPRGFRAPPMVPYGGGGRGIPPFLPPGARFDPFGPPNPMPNAPPRPQQPPGGFGVPNPDVEQPPPGFDDMFM